MKAVRREGGGFDLIPQNHLEETMLDILGDVKEPFSVDLVPVSCGENYERRLHEGYEPEDVVRALSGALANGTHTAD